MPTRGFRRAALSAGVVPEDRDLAAVPVPVALEDLDGRGLAGAVGPEQGEDLSDLDLEVETVHRGDAAVVLREAFDDDGGRARHPGSGSGGGTEAEPLEGGRSVHGAEGSDYSQSCQHRSRGTCVAGSAVGLDPVALGGGDGDLGVGPDEPLDGIQHLGDVGGVGGDDGEAELGALPLVVVTGLGGRHGETPTCCVEEVPHDGTLVLEGPAGIDRELDRQHARLHGDSLSGDGVVPPAAVAAPGAKHPSRE